MIRILLGFSYHQSGSDVAERVRAWVDRLNLSELGVEIEPVCLTLDPPGPRLTWRQLDFKWKFGDPELYELYASIYEKTKRCDVFLNWNGINCHPDFVEKLPCLTVYSCFDDPESSDDLSKPVAGAYDLCLVGNIAEVETYKNWGVENVHFWPLGYAPEDCGGGITEEQIRGGARTEDVVLLCERTTSWRKERLDRFTTAFPKGHYYGRGWPSGFIDEEQKLALYKKAKIGLNLHNSTGPINLRTYMLPANGVMLLCDNKSYLADLYRLGEEAVGFDSIEEAIELCHYYLQNDEERKNIAVAGWKRAIQSYNDVASFAMGLTHIKAVLKLCDPKDRSGYSVSRMNMRRYVGRATLVILSPLIAAKRWLAPIS